MFIVIPKTQLQRVRKALAKLEGLPKRGQVFGGPDFTSDVVGSPGWTVQAVDDGDDDGTTACVEIPDRLLKWCGQTITIAAQQVTIPTLDQLAADESALPDTLRAVRAAKRAAATDPGSA